MYVNIAKMKKIIAFILGVIIVSGFVYAVGSSSSSGGSSGGSSSNNNNDNTQEPPRENENLSCDNIDTLRERIQCRLENNEEGNGADESCKGLTRASRCQTLYNLADRCYLLLGTEKDACFRQVIGFSSWTLRDEASKNKDSIREYVVLLLYDLQERAENAYDENKITSDEASDLINQIVETKRIILENGSKEQIRAAIISLKSKWSMIMEWKS